MNRVRFAIAIAVPAALPACASAPAVQVSVEGALPVGRSLQVLQTGVAADAVTGPVGQCLADAGMVVGQPPQVLAHIVHAVRPARSRVLRSEAEAQQKRHRPGARLDREELTLAITDRETGAVLTRAAVVRTLPGKAVVGDGADLAQRLCGALIQPVPAAASR